MKLKLSPSLRIKRRYFLVNSKNQEDIEEYLIKNLGVLGWAKAMIVFIKMKGGKGIVLSVDRKEAENVKKMIEKDGKIKIINISGTLKGLGH